MYACVSGVTYEPWIVGVCRELGIPLKRPIEVMQDNKSTIQAATNGPSFKRGKHILIKRSYLRKKQVDGDVTYKYCASKEMWSDILTKAVPAEIFIYITSFILFDLEAGDE